MPASTKANEAAFAAVIAAPFGHLGLAMERGCLTRVEFLARSVALQEPADPDMARVAEQLGAYFDGRRAVFSLPLRPLGSPFQQRVWAALAAIPCGTTTTYGALARRLGTSARAVGGACRANPVPVVVPCHRVVAASGIGGFAGHTEGPELDRKRWLLAHEGAGDWHRPGS